MADSTRTGFLRDDATQALRVVGYSDRDNGRSSLQLPVMPGSSSAFAASAKTIYLRVVPSRTMTIVNIAHVVGVAAGVDDTVEYGFMSAAGVRIVTTGAVAGKLNATGVKVTPITATILLPGTVYYLAMATTAPGGTAAQLCGRNMAFASCWDLTGATVPNVEAANENAVTAIPATMGALSAQITGYPNIDLREV